MSEVKSRPEKKPMTRNDEDIDISSYQYEGAESGVMEDLTQLDEQERQQLLMAGVDVSGKDRSGTFLQMDHSNVHCSSCIPGVEVLDIHQALSKYDGLKEYYWKAVDPDKDKYTRAVADKTHGGYFIRTEKGAKVTNPIQSCLFIKGEKVGQNVHNIIVVEEDSELHIITGCAVSHQVESALHMGISEIYIKRGGKLSFTMVHNWGEEVHVRPRTVGIVEQDGVFLNNYILLKPVRSAQLYPTLYLNGKGAVATSNSVIAAPPGSYINSGSRVVLNAPETRAEIIARTITTGGTIINPGHLVGNAVPAKGHLECKGLILKDGIIHAIPELEASVAGVELSHEAAVGKVAQEEIEYLMARGLDEDEATSTIVRGFLNVDIMGLPQELQDAIDQTIQEAGDEMF
ncbi:SufB/SufD family protein [Desulfovermiculus halophilus]|uniref:SufB/SufD family protein n=1 Tax=Desulfovermiculus halophilus TaxID=339722 RepID=UPI000A401C8E